MNDRTVRPARNSGPDSRALILDAAAQLFSEFGYAATSMRQVAAHVGLGQASVYHHFASKEVILLEVLGAGLTRMLESTRSAVQALAVGSDARQRLEAAIAGHLRGIQRDLAYTTTNARFQGQLSPEGRERLRPLRTAYTEYWRGLMSDARREGLLNPLLDDSMARALLLGSLNRTVAWFKQDKGPIEQLIRTTIAAFSGIWAQNRAPTHYPGTRQRRSALPHLSARR